MKIRRLLPRLPGLLASASFILLVNPALASEPKERVICTDAPQSTWMSEAEARKRFHAERYMLLTFKISGERCHEFYAVKHDGSAIEAYVHPVTGEVVRMTRISPTGERTDTGSAVKPALPKDHKAP